jgi:hypothetical protein
VGAEIVGQGLAVVFPDRVVELGGWQDYVAARPDSRAERQPITDSWRRQRSRDEVILGAIQDSVPPSASSCAHWRLPVQCPADRRALESPRRRDRSISASWVWRPRSIVGSWKAPTYEKANARVSTRAGRSTRATAFGVGGRSRSTVSNSSIRPGLECRLRPLAPSYEACAAPAPWFRASTALTVFSSSRPKTRLPKSVSTPPSNRPLTFLPSRTTTASRSVVPSDCGVNV